MIYPKTCKPILEQDSYTIRQKKSQPVGAFEFKANQNARARPTYTFLHFENYVGDLLTLFYFL